MGKSYSQLLSLIIFHKILASNLLNQQLYIACDLFLQNFEYNREDDDDSEDGEEEDSEF